MNYNKKLEQSDRHEGLGHRAPTCIEFIHRGLAAAVARGSGRCKGRCVRFLDTRPGCRFRRLTVVGEVKRGSIQPQIETDRCSFPHLGRG